MNLPIVDKQDNFVSCQHLVNEALLGLDHHVKGPIHINVLMKPIIFFTMLKKLPDVVRFERLDKLSEDAICDKKIELLKKTRKILVVCGQMSHVSEKLKNSLEEFFKKFNASLTLEHMANINSGGYKHFFVF